MILCPDSENNYLHYSSDNFRGNPKAYLIQAWYLSDYIRHVRGPDQASVQVFMNVKVCGQFFMLIIIIVENGIVIEGNCDNIVTFATRCRCQNPVRINYSASTKIKLLSYIFKYFPRTRLP